MDLQDYAKRYNAEVIEEDDEIKVRLSCNFSFKCFVGHERYWLAKDYITDRR